MNQLTQTETKVVHFISQGLCFKEIADKMYVSAHTVHTHARNVRKKLGARNIADITRMYILSLDDPRLVMKAVFFLLVQLGLIFCEPTMELRKPGAQRVVRAKCGRKGRNKSDYHV